MTIPVQTTIQNANAEKSILNAMLNDLKLKIYALEESLKTYSTSKYVTMAKIPSNIKSLEMVLDRFLKEKKIENLFELVDNNPHLLEEAIKFTQNPGKIGKRSAYNEAYMALKTIKNNLEEYKQFGTKSKAQYVEQGYITTTGTGKFATIDNKDGFKNYVEKAQIIANFVESYDKLITYTGGETLDSTKLPETLHSLKIGSYAQSASDRLMIAPEADSKANEQESPSKANSFDFGGEQHIAMINDEARRIAVNEVTNKKYACYQESILLTLKYTQCSNSRDLENIDLRCAPIQVESEHSKANCDSHFPMRTVTDSIIETMLGDIGKAHIISNPDQTYQIDYSTPIAAVISYGQLGRHLIDNSAIHLIAEFAKTQTDYLANAMNYTETNAALLLGTADQLLTLPVNDN